MFPNTNHKQLFDAIAKIRSSEEATNFFRDLLTIGEIDAATERWHIARLLWTTTLSYKKIAEKTHASTTTITRVAHWMENGKGGYKTILTRLFGPRK